MGVSPEKDQTRNPREAICFKSEYGRLGVDYSDLIERWDRYLQTAIDIFYGDVYPIHGGGQFGIGILLGSGESRVHGGSRLNFYLSGTIRFSQSRYDRGIVLSNISRVIVNSRRDLQIHGETDSYTQIFAISPAGEVNMRMLPKSPVHE